MASSTEAVSTPAIADHPVRAALLLGALGVVFGDIGTSPIYAFREALKAAGGPSEAAVFGVLSLVFWAVVLVVAIKYVVFVMKADNRGEGGTMALLSLALPVAGRLQTGLLVVGLAGASLFFGDAMITPAISVLSAVEGLRIVSPMVTPYVVPIAAVVLVCLFSIQSRGSGAVTGGEERYAEMGHFGRSAIRPSWFAFVALALVLVYLGQGALVLADPAAAENPFFLLFPTWLLAPAILLTTAATVIASQAVLSGAFALVQQAIQLGAIPRLEVRQTSEESAGQVYVPQVNWVLAALVLALVFGFRSSDALANAYGIAVAGDMMVTTLLVTVVAYALWRWPAILVFPVAGLFFLLDLTFVSANVHKIPAGGWFPLLIGFIALTLMLVWRKGRRIAFEQRDQNAIDLATFIGSLDQPGAPERMNGTAVYLTKETHLVPAALELNVRHNGIVHKHVVLLKVTTEHSPRVDEGSRVKATPLASGFRLLWLVFGFAEKPDVPAALRLHPEALGCDPDEASFFLGRETPVPSLRPHLSGWQQRLYAFMTRNAVAAPDYFLIPSARVVELGTRVEM